MSESKKHSVPLGITEPSVLHRPTTGRGNTMGMADKRWYEPTDQVIESIRLRVEQTRETRDDKRSLAWTDPGTFIYVLGALAMGNSKSAIARHLNVNRGVVYRIEREYCEEIGEWKGLCYREMEVLAAIGRDKLKEALLKYEVPDNVNARDIKELAAANHFINAVRERVSAEASTLERVEEEDKPTAQDVAALNSTLMELMQKAKAKTGNQIIDVDLSDEEDIVDA